MSNIFCKKYNLYKTIVLDEMYGIQARDFKSFDTSLCLDFKIFTDKKEVIKHSNEFRLANSIGAIFFARIEIDEEYYIYMQEKKAIDGAILISKEELEELNSHIIDKGAINTVFLEQVFEYNSSLIDIPLWTVFSLGDQGVTIDNDYFDYVLSFRRPYKHGGYNLFLSDFYNRKYKDELGKIVVYKQEPTLYEDVLSAVLDNYDKRYRFGFEKLHNLGIVPACEKSRSVRKFGVEIEESSFPPENPYIAYLNESMENLYRWKYGKKALKCYNDPFFRDQDDGQTLEDFISKEVRYQCFVSLLEMDFQLRLDKSEKVPVVDREKYLNSIEIILNRYVYDGKSVFQKVNDLNNYQDCSGIYVLCFDYERKMYVGQTQISFKERILQHFIKPQSNFDKNHSLEEVSNIYVLNVSTEYLDYVEMDCIASIEPSLLFNVFAGGKSVEMISSKRYNPQQYLLDDIHRALISEQAFLSDWLK